MVVLVSAILTGLIDDKPGVRPGNFDARTHCLGSSLAGRTGYYVARRVDHSGQVSRRSRYGLGCAYLMCSAMHRSVLRRSGGILVIRSPRALTQHDSAALLPNGFVNICNSSRPLMSELPFQWAVLRACCLSTQDVVAELVRLDTGVTLQTYIGGHRLLARTTLE